MIEITHRQCEKLGFYVVGIPVGRRIEYFDACNALGMPNAQGKIVMCESCQKKVDLDDVNEYYELNEV